jgi:NUDIX domain-containing protein
MEFGSRLPGQHYQPRPGSYAVAVRDNGRVAVIETRRGCFLPGGGGAQPGESPEETLAREVWEERESETEIIGPIRLATENVFALAKATSPSGAYSSGSNSAYMCRPGRRATTG